MKKFLVGLILACLIGIPTFTAQAAQNEAVFIQKNNPGQIFSDKTKILRHNIRMILKDRRFDYPDRFRQLKGLWRQIAGWLAKIKSQKRTVDSRIWQKIFRGFGLASLLLLPFLLLYYLPKMFVHSRKVKNFKEAGHPRANVDSPDDLKYQAQRLAEKGQLREAIRLLYLTGLELLQKNRILPDSSLRLSDKTNLQIILHAFGPNHPGYHAFSELVLVFQEKWFGLRSCQIEDYHRLIEDLKIIETTMGNPHVET